ncbi:MAG: hypothetical protein GVY26_12485 [Bacteroidetes bacterium]|jgi:FKBP-type peptidyl-prolyl cis-trans isomerase FkpA|nr:hypothetical protein [Bacteroidota bacterium]
MRIYIVFALFVALSLAACQPDGGGSSSDVQTTENGFEYIMHVDEEGEQPQAGEYAYFHAQIRNGDSVLMSTRQQQGRPAFMEISNMEQRPNPVSDVLKLLSAEDSATIIIDLDTIPQEQRQPGFKDADNMYYDIVLTDILSKQEHQAKMAEMQAEQQAKVQELAGDKDAVAQLVSATLEQYKNDALGDELQETASGLKYVIHEQGDGAQAEPGNEVFVHYYGVLAEDGTMFDNSYKRGEPFSFQLGQGMVIPGWDEGVALLQVGDEATFFVPSELGYGQRGGGRTIPPNAELVFHVKLLDVQ